MERSLFGEEHKIFQKAVRQFIDREVRPQQKQWLEAGIVSREVWKKAGEAGLLCTWLDERYGGPGGDFLHATIVIEELARAYESGFAAPLHSDIVVPYIHRFGNDAQKDRWLASCARGETITAVAMTEPDAGSDLASMKMTARKDGDSWILNGNKTFISNGILCDLCVVAAKTGDAETDPHTAISLFLVEADRPGFSKGKKLEKIGMHSQDTAELHFEDCRIPAGNLLGHEGAGFIMLMQALQQERLVVAIAAQAIAETVLQDTLNYCQERKAFKRPISKFQNTQFKLVDAATQVEIGRHFLDRLVSEHAAGKYLVKECSMAKCWQTEMAQRVIDDCLQLYGGYGYMTEYPVARAFVDARVQRIYAGTNEIMKVIIAKQMGL
ncbi:MAG: acyl-CoA dehydrogenase family protein [Deltaproteobacteria bacterium]|nr:acyl-CoA dehydrogenase family protein [Deltaproteobacteria bacterium]